jgi:hypothetical protein
MAVKHQEKPTKTNMRDHPDIGIINYNYYIKLGFFLRTIMLAVKALVTFILT